MKAPPVKEKPDTQPLGYTKDAKGQPALPGFEALARPGGQMILEDAQR